MPDEFIKVDVQGEEKIIAAIQQWPRQVSVYLGAAGREAATRIVFPTKGLKKYPGITAANRPPTPYYIRGRGMQYKSKNTLTSERLGTQFYSQTEKGGFVTEIGNRASYSQYVVGDNQARAMGAIGWRKLREVIEEKMPQIREVYQVWIDKLIKKLGL